MRATGKRVYSQYRDRLVALCAGPHMLAFVPALCLAVFWLGGEAALVVLSLAIPLAVVLINPSALHTKAQALRQVRGLVPRQDFETVVSELHVKCRQEGRQSAVFLLELFEYDQLVERYGQAAGEAVVARVAERFEALLRETDVVTRLSDARLGVCIDAVQHIDLEAGIQLAGRLQTAAEEPIAVDGTTVYVTGAVGFCMLNRAPGQTGRAWFEAAETALSEARKRGPNGIRAYSNELRKKAAARNSLREEARQALENGQIQPWYQPQISTDTGRVTGFEALARWNHPERGQISPAEFLPVFEDAGLIDRMGEIILYHSLTALKAWDATGVTVPCVGVNFSGSELNNPRLAEKIQWELDRFDLTPDRLAVEVLETVVSSSPGDVVSRNVRALGEMGCRIDLDDFGTGNASIAAIRRFNVSRIKIDRSFVTKADRDPDQRRMITAILTMAERLNIETLAEGVETVGEHALLAQLGCNHVQGFGIGRPMAFDKTIDWIAQHEQKLGDTPALPSRRAGGG